jgi:hypothetical protein
MNDYSQKANRSNSWDNSKRPGGKFDWNKMNENMKGFTKNTEKFK